MRRLKLFILLGFAIMFVAGLEVGRSHTTLASIEKDWHDLIHPQPVSPPTTQPTAPPKKPAIFGIELTPAQDTQIKQIFADARKRSDAISHQFPDIDRQREAAINEILTTEQRAELVEIDHEHDSKITAERSDIAAIMKKAGDDVRATLNPDQQKQYDDVHVKWEHEHHPHGGRGNGPRSGRPRGGPDTAPDHSADPAPAK